MKKVIMALAILAVFAAGVDACEPYTVLWYTEGDDPTLEACEVAPPAPYAEFMVRTWVRNDPVDGFLTVQFGVDLAGNICTGTVSNPSIALEQNAPTGNDWVASFSECQYDEWVWLVKYTFLYGGTPGYLTFMPAATTGVINVATCIGGEEGDLPPAPLTIGNAFGVNEPCEVDSETESWGAVKSMYHE